MTIFRRFLVLQLLMLWQGGFLFYALFVVPVGTELLGSSLEQGKITRHVAISMNLVGTAALVVFAWDQLHAPPKSKRQRWTLWSCWIVMAAGLAVLFLLHPRMEDLVDFDTSKHRDRDRFRFFHRTYLWISTVQWFAGLIFAAVIVATWRAGDGLASREA